MRNIAVSDGEGLQNALANARPGDVITLADAEYADTAVKHAGGREPGRFAISRSGTASAPITLCGSRNAILNGLGTSRGYAVHLIGASYWRLLGFTVRTAAKGIVFDRASHNLVADVHVTDIGQEGIHFRAFSTDNVLRSSVIDNTGRTSPNYGEGVYVGSAQSNWGRHSDGQADRSDRNQILENRIFDTTAECIDIKEGTTGGVIRGNCLSGNKITGGTSADSCVDIKGNGYLIASNHGVTAPNNRTVLRGDPGDASGTAAAGFSDGMQVHVVTPGWGAANVFAGNLLEVDAPGIGIRLQNTAVDQGNVICRDNIVTGTGSRDFAYDHPTAIACSICSSLASRTPRGGNT